MNIVATDIPDVKLIEPKVFRDDRGFFLESFNALRWAEDAGIADTFVQDNHSRSEKNVVRGLHYQVIKPQGKLVRVVVGEIFDVAVDMRQNSPTFGKWTAAELSAENKQQLWVPVGFAHGFMVLSDYAEVLYKSTDYYCPEGECCLLWDDPDLAIRWPTRDNVRLSQKDLQALRFKDATYF